MKSNALVCLALSLFMAAAQAEEDIRIPNGINLGRLKKIDAQYAKGGESKESHKLMVFATMTSIDSKDTHLLFPNSVGKGMGSAEQLKQRFKTTISSTNRFDFRDERQTDIAEGIVVEAMITAANQNLEDYQAFSKSVTTVRMSVAVKDLETGAVISSKNLSAVYGSETGEGTVIKTQGALKGGLNRGALKIGVCLDTAACQNLKNDYDKALKELFENLASFIEKSFRPIAKVIDIDGEEITLLGSVKHGFNQDEELVVFRTRPLSNEEGKPLPPAVKAIAVVQCSAGDNLSCRVIRKGKNGNVQKGDYAVPSDKMMKFQE